MARTSGVQQLAVTALAFASLCLVAGCPVANWPTTAADKQDPTLKPFLSAQEVASYYRSQANAQQSNGGVFVGLFGMASVADMATDAAGGAEGDGSYSTTNIQTAGVDEADVFKSDGQYFYIADGAVLRIVDAVPAAAMVAAGALELDDEIVDLYLTDDTVITLGYHYETAAGAPGDLPFDLDTMMWPPYYERVSTVVTQIDVSDRTQPTVVAQLTLDGGLATSRLTNGRLVVVTTIYPEIFAEPLGYLTLTAGDVTPKASTADGAEPLVAVEDWYHPGAPDGYETTVVATLDASDVETIIGSLAIAAPAWTIYMSQEALYISDDEYDADYDFRATTSIHKIVFDADGAPQYAASGAVPGRLLNQFSLDEYEGDLRVATHVDELTFWGFALPVFDGVATAEIDDVSVAAQESDATTPYNGVYVLRQTDDVLDIIGYVDGVAPGEDLYAARFMGDHGFLVTFERIDPLFVLDLGDPEAPQVAGEVELPGFSEYLHPFGDDRLIGVGSATSTSEWGWTSIDGVQLTLFDVSDWTAPSVVQQVTIKGDYARTDVSWTHKAFTFLPDDGLLALPVLLYDYSDYYSEQGLMMCYHVDPDAGFVKLGEIECAASDDDWTTTGAWRRGAFIDDVLYAVDIFGVRAAPVDDFANVSELALPASSYQPYWYVADADDGVSE